MQISHKVPSTIDQYILLYSEDVQIKLNDLRNLVRKLVPQADEAIRYGIPTFRFNGNLLHFAAYKNHIGFYPTPAVITAFKSELRSYKQSKGAVQFPIDRPLPLELIESMVKYRIKQVEVQSSES